MARIRSIKPSRNLDDELAVLGLAAWKLIVSLPMYADKLGRLEDRPMRIKAQVFPYENIEVEPLLAALHRKRFIHRYETDGTRYIQIENWDEDQKPHHTEQTSKIPDPSLNHQGIQEVTEHNAPTTVSTPLSKGESNVEERQGNGKWEIGNGHREPGKGEAQAPTSPAGDSLPSPSTLLKIFQEENRVLPAVKEFTKDREDKCRARLNHAKSRGDVGQYLNDFREAVKKAQKTPFLTGANDRGWRANFDWFLTSHKNVYAVLEGKYDSAAGGSPPERSVKDEIDEANKKREQERERLRAQMREIENRGKNEDQRGTR